MAKEDDRKKDELDVDLELEEEEEEEEEEEFEAEEEEEGEEEEPGDEGDEDDETLTVAELQEKLANKEKEHEGVKRELWRMRERTRLSRTRAHQQALYDQTDEGDEGGRGKDDDDDDGRVEIDVGDDGKMTFDRKDLMRDTRRATRPTHPVNPAVAQAQKQAEQYQRVRMQLLDEADDPAETADTLDELELAYGYLDRMVGQAAQEIGVAPQGEEGLSEMITAEGLDRRFARRFPGVDWKKLIRAPQDPYALRDLVLKREEKGQRKRGDEEEETGKRKKKALRTGDRPRSMRRGRRRAKPKVSAKALEEMDPEDILKLTDEEIEEFERAM